MFGGQSFGGTYFAGMFPWLQERVRRVTGWGPPAVASAGGRGVLIQPRPLLTRAVGRAPDVKAQPGVTDEELLVIATLVV